MSEELVTVAHHSTAWEAELLRAHLQAQGIESVVQGVELATLQSLHASSWLSVQVQVREEDAVRATRLVAEHDALRAAHRGRPVGETCLACGTALAAEDTRCRACGWTWDVRG